MATRKIAAVVVIAGIALLGGAGMAGAAEYSRGQQATSAGTCVTFTGRITVVQCVPNTGPGNTRRVSPIFEDGSAVFGPAGSRWAFDAEDHTFRRI